MPSLHFVAVAHCVGLMKPNTAGAERVPAHNACMVKCTTFDRSQIDLITTGCCLVCDKVFIRFEKSKQKTLYKFQYKCDSYNMCTGLQVI